MIPAGTFLDACHARGFGFITGTPCSYLKPLINAAIDDARFRFCDAVNEGDAVAMAAGSVLGGGRALVMFQNSGLGNAVNALTSLCHPFRVPLLLVITHRGQPGGPPDEPQHEQMGRITTALLDTLEIPWAPFPDKAEAVDGALDAALASLGQTRRPFAFVLGQDGIAPQALRAKPAPTAPGLRQLSFEERLTRRTDARANRTEALALVRAARRADEVLVATTGHTGRELFALGDDPWNLYVVGSMGSASALALGLSLQLPGRPVTVLDGDGALLMRMGNLATLGAHAPAALTHVVLDNEAHDSTGGQATVSAGVAFAAIAQACGYRRAVSTDDPEVLRSELDARRGTGPVFIHFRIRKGCPDKLPRPDVPPEAVWRRLQRWLGVDS